MSKYPSIIYETLARFDGLKAIGVSRHAEKRLVRAAAARRGVLLPWGTLSTGRIHADKTLDVYKGVALRYVQWGRHQYGVRHLADLDAEAACFVALYLEARLAAGDSPWTVQTIRSALRMFHRPCFDPAEREERVRQLGNTVPLPLRRREEITRSRGPVAMDAEIALERYRPLVAFCRATGLRRRELEALTVGDIKATGQGCLWVAVHHGKGGKCRAVPVLPGYEEDVLTVVIGRPAEALVFPRIPVRLDVHHYRRLYAQALFSENGRRALPAPEGRLSPGSVDAQRALVVARALGHERIDIVLRHYLR